jgi:pimeloyl-ACP methyl ester carboxylesterase/SAM-dependent methyltransferase
MERVTVNGVSLAYDEFGSGRETVVMSHSYLVDRHQFDAQARALSEHYRVLTFDHRGHGDSDATADYSMRAIYEDAVGFIEATGAAPCHFVGLSTGGFVGLRLALWRPDLLRSLVLMDTSAGAEPMVERAKYRLMLAVARSAGMRPVIGSIMKIMFGPDSRRDRARAGELAAWRQRIMDNDVDAMIGFGRAIFDRASVIDRLGWVDVPTLVMVGEHDRGQPVARSRAMVDHIDRAHLVIVPGAGHLATIERPDIVSSALLDFFEHPTVTPVTERPLRTPRSTHYDGWFYGRLVEPFLAGVHTWVADHLPAGERVLDVGCGTGGLARKIAAAGRQVVGVDLSPRNIEYAERRSLDSAATFRVADASSLPDAERSFDVATVVMALHEMPQTGRRAVLGELARVAGRIVIVDYAVPQPRNVSGVRNRVVELAAGPDHFGAFRDYVRLGGLDTVLDECGLDIVDDRTLNQGTLRAVTAARHGSPLILPG